MNIAENIQKFTSCLANFDDLDFNSITTSAQLKVVKTGWIFYVMQCVWVQKQLKKILVGAGVRFVPFDFEESRTEPLDLEKYFFFM